MHVAPMLKKQPVVAPSAALARRRQDSAAVRRDPSNRDAQQAEWPFFDDRAASDSRCLQRKLAIGAADDALEQEADRVAERVLRTPVRDWEPRPAHPRVARKCAACDLEDEKLRRKESAAGAMALGDAPSIVHETLRSPGQPLDRKSRDFFEPRFGYDFSGVRIHAGSQAAESAGAVNSYAYTVGRDIVFHQGQYAPNTPHGRRLLAHELAHVVQQSHMSRRIQRFSYAEFKEKAYEHLINGLRAAKKAALDALRARVGDLPPKWYGAANTIISVIDEVLGVIETLILAIIGLVVGFGEGAVGLVTGIIKLGYGILKLLYDLAIGAFTNFEALKQDWDAFAKALLNLPTALRNLVTDWLDHFEKASLERQSLMIAELVGQIEALIASFGVAASRAGSAATLTETGSEVAGATARATAGTAAQEAAAAGTQATRPALTVIQGGGRGAARAAQASAGASRGNLALKLAPAIEDAPAVSPVRLVPPLPAAQPAAAAANTAATAAASGARAKIVATVAVGAPTTARQLKDPCADCSKANWRRFNRQFMNAKLAQIQSVPNHPLSFLITNGAWANRTSMNEVGVHAGHRIGRRGCEWGFGLLRLAVERGWENLYDSDTERNAAVLKETVMIEGVEVDLGSAIEWQKEGHLQGIDLKALSKSTPSEGWRPGICF
ncbi:eCIS core domain-containing protein [Paraburkholderia sp. HP33-1]|uniref:eCIS core domain-containing protein n=1 Tax=Paraburkholderia sp. HP33-1 TaxID=2883243 RepID=UPI001F439368|nr:DUF4157 domain-containing protein [Paraburkholderia sp. HP33-1]